MLFENDGKSYAMIDLYLNDRFSGYKDSYNYYDTDVGKILLFKKSDNESIIRYNDVNNCTTWIKNNEFLWWIKYICKQ